MEHYNTFDETLVNIDKGTSSNLTTSMMETKQKNDLIERSVKHETTELDLMSKNQEEIDRFYQSQITKPWGLWDKWTNRSMYDQVQDVKMELLKTSANYRVAFYKTLLETRLEYFNERCDAGLKMIKGHYRQQVATFLTKKLQELSIEVRDQQIAFIKMMMEKYDYARSLANYPRLQKRFDDSIAAEEDRYLLFLSGLLDKFESILNEEFKRYNP